MKVPLARISTADPARAISPTKVALVLAAAVGGSLRVKSVNLIKPGPGKLFVQCVKQLHKSMN
jgi:hypothetical protein